MAGPGCRGCPGARSARGWPRPRHWSPSAAAGTSAATRRSRPPGLPGGRRWCWTRRCRAAAWRPAARRCCRTSSPAGARPKVFFQVGAACSFSECAIGYVAPGRNRRLTASSGLMSPACRRRTPLERRGSPGWWRE
jgi:hypothetical protein